MGSQAPGAPFEIHSQFAPQPHPHLLPYPGRELNELVLCTMLVLKQQPPEGAGIRAGRGGEKQTVGRTDVLRK